MKIIILQLIAFSLPLAPYILPGLIVFLLLIWLLEGNFKEKWFQFARNPLGIFLPILYFLYLLGLLWSNNIDYAVSDLETKLTLLLFPMIILSHKFEKEHIRLIKHSFIQGCLLAVLLLLLLSFYKYNIFKVTTFFYYNSFTIHLHPSYFALYLNFALVLIIDKIMRGQLKLYWVFFYLLSALLLILAIFLSASKSGILTLFFSLVGGTILLVNRRFLFHIALILIAIVITIFSISKVVNEKLDFFFNSNTISSFSEPIKDRFNALYNSLQATSIDNETTSSSSVRVLVWESAKEIVSENLFFGVGTGDVKVKLIEKYNEKGITGAAKIKLNAHNQFLQTTIALGTLGFFLLIVNLFIPLFFAIKFKSWIFLLFLLLIIFNLITESLLERQAGVIFFAFFNSILLFTINPENKENGVFQ